VGGGSTVAEKVHASVRCFASVTVQFTVVVPIGNGAPLTGVHVGPVSGSNPDVTVGAVYDTTTGLPSDDSVVTAAGQVIFGAPGSGVVGVVGVAALAPQPAVVHATTATATDDRKTEGRDLFNEDHEAAKTGADYRITAISRTARRSSTR
jgi:hypothetical protein